MLEFYGVKFMDRAAWQFAATIRADIIKRYGEHNLVEVRRGGYPVVGVKWDGKTHHRWHPAKFMNSYGADLGLPCVIEEWA